MERQRTLGLEPLTQTQADKLVAIVDGYEDRIRRQKEIINRLQFRTAELEKENQSLRYRAQANEREDDGG